MSSSAWKRSSPNAFGTPAVGAAGTLQRMSMFSGSLIQKMCPNCKDRSVIVYDSKAGDELCNRCGLVIEGRVLSDVQEWRNFSSTDGAAGTERSRVGGPNDAWLQDGVQGTSMVGGDKTHQKLLHTHEMATAMSSTDRQLKTAFGNLRVVADSIVLREGIVERCKEIVKDLQVAGHLKNRTQALYMLGVIYIACREEGNSRSLKELVSYDQGITERELGRAINRLKKLLPTRSQPQSFGAADLMPRFCMRLNLSQEVATVAEHVCRRTEQIISQSHRLNSVTAGVLYLVTQLFSVDVRISDIAAVARTGESTVRNVYKEILPLVRTLLPDNFRPKPGALEALKRTP